ncbi:hypothetical protein [Ammoniphilus sp. CFH 90114]|uniref:NAD(P)H-dependent amine dehydrogenase family protein n=1 Tax=Ammoniphilus sp. CFH 90114 TaxID=2493665 RepID=UPI00100FC038|nr:hypothetical protein [Ammoniphilus sp. CFH 90114]RXT04325.1 hypothetical protein EIZ39_20825 [Ammoniphilus sp. CFH 90114]
MSNQKLNLVSYGLGPIGLEILKRATQATDIQVLGAVDIDPNKIGQDIGTLVSDNKMDRHVVSSIVDIPACNDFKVAIHATGSNLERVWPQMRDLLDQGYSVVSTCEELSYPWHRYPELSAEIDAYAKEKGLTVLGTGVNPGFIMDTMVVALTGVTNSMSGIKVNRRVDVSKRRIPLQKKVGIGMAKEEFEQLANENRIGHVGLEESLRMVAYGLNWELEEVSNFIEPTISKANDKVDLCDILAGQVNGLHQESRGRTRDGKEIVLDLVMSVGVKQEDEIIIEGSEPKHLVIPGGIFGDTATAAIALNSAKLVSLTKKAGLLTMVDAGVPRNVYLG